MVGGGGGGKGEEPAREIPDEITDEILLRLPSCSALVRAAAASGAFRALVSSPRFLRRHRALHRDPGALLGVFTFSLSHDGAGGDGGAAAPRRAASPRPRRASSTAPRPGPSGAPSSPSSPFATCCPATTSCSRSS